MPHKHAFQQIYAICPLRGKLHPTLFPSYGPSIFTPWDVSIVKYFNHRNSVFSPLNPKLDVTQVWVEFPPLVIN